MPHKSSAKRKSFNAAYYAANKRKILAQQRKRKLQQNYGLTLEQYEEMLAEQDGRCAICRKRPKGRKRLHVDHDHDTNDVRALLCVRCNTQLGTVETFGARAEAYLRKYGSTTTRR